MWTSCGPVKLSHKANFHKPAVASRESFMFTFGNEENCCVSIGVVGVLFLSVVNVLCLGDKNLYKQMFYKYIRPLIHSPSKHKSSWGPGWALGGEKVSSPGNSFSSLEIRKVDATRPLPWVTWLVPVVKGIWAVCVYRVQRDQASVSVSELSSGARRSACIVVGIQGGLWHERACS